MNKACNESEKTLYNRWKRVKELPFSGWDFSYISEKIMIDPLPWDYKDEVQKFIKKHPILLDMDTGGGEFLSSLSELPINTYATESYPPNVTIAAEKLRNFNVKVIQVDEAGSLPFKNDYFDLIINRHSYYSPEEVHRICKSDGIFVTQQVGSKDWVDLKHALGVQNEQSHLWNLDSTKEQIIHAGFKFIKGDEIIDGKVYFKDVETIIYHLVNIPWVIPDFSIDKYFDRLLALHRKCVTQKWLTFHQHRFYLAVKKAN